jgi:hypothetical protein
MRSKSLIGTVWLAFACVLVAASAAAQDAAATASPALVGALAKELGSTPQQAEGAAGALFGLAKSKLSPADWSKVAGAVPGMDGLLKAAPAAAPAAGGCGVASIPGMAGLGGLSSIAPAFSKLGLKPEMAAKAVPVLTSFVSKSGGPDVGKLLAGALK